MTEELGEDVVQRLMRQGWAPVAGCEEAASMLAVLAASPSDDDVRRAAHHVAGCEACGADLAMSEALLATPDAIEARRDDLDWMAQRLDAVLADELGLGTVGQAEPAGEVVALSSWRRAWAPLALAATVLIAIGLTAGPGLPDLADGPGARGVVRGSDVVVLTPGGRVDAAPDTLAWGAVDGAHAYAVSLVRADGASVWSTTVQSGTEVPVPDDVRAGLQRATTYVWTVTALAADGDVVATSEPQRVELAP